MLNKDPYIVPGEAPLIILDSKSAVCMAKNGKDTKKTRHIVRMINFVRNGEKCKIQKIDWCGGGLQLADIATKNVGDNDLTPIMKYIMVRLDTWDRTLLQEGWQNTGYYMEQELCMTRLDWVEDSTQSVWNVCRILKTIFSRMKKMLFWRKTALKENHV